MIKLLEDDATIGYGELFLISSGEYSDYRTDGLYRATKSFSLKEARERYAKEARSWATYAVGHMLHKSRNDVDGRSYTARRITNTETLAMWLVLRSGWVVEVEHQELWSDTLYNAMNPRRVSSDWGEDLTREEAEALVAKLTAEGE